METLRISLLGNVRIERGACDAQTRISRTALAIFAYLLVQRDRAHRRETLATVFWGDQSDSAARNCLNTALWRLRRALEGSTNRGMYLTTTPAGDIRFNRESDHWLDVDIFERLLGSAHSSPHSPMQDTDARAIVEGLELYHGDLLEDFHDEWALYERERVRLLYLNGLASMLHYHRDHRQFEESIHYGQRILVHDPLREEIHRELIRLYVATGQRAQAIRQYQQCRDILATELGIPVMEETQQLYAQVTCTVSNPPPRTLRAPVADMQDTLAQLYTLAADLDTTRMQVQRIIAELETRHRPS